MEILYGKEEGCKYKPAMQHLDSDLSMGYNPNARIVNGDFTNNNGDGDDGSILFYPHHRAGGNSGDKVPTDLYRDSNLDRALHSNQSHNNHREIPIKKVNI